MVMRAVPGAEELVEYASNRMPIRSRLLGREVLRDAVMVAIAAWPIDELLAASGAAGRKDALSRVSKETLRTVRLMHGSRFGNPLLAILLPALISALVQVVLKWWLDKRSRRMKMAVWKYELRGATL
jgi:hypothetical protein